MTTDDKIRDEKLEYDIAWEAAKTSALLSGKIHLVVKRYGKYSLEILKQKEIFDELVNERMFATNKLNEEIDLNNLTYTSISASKYSVCFKSALIRYNDIKNGRISLQEEKNSRRILMRAKWNIKRKYEL